MKINHRRLSRLTVVGIIVAVLFAGIVTAATFTWISNNINYTINVHETPLELAGNIEVTPLTGTPYTNSITATVNTIGLTLDSNYRGYVKISFEGATTQSDVTVNCKVLNTNYDYSGVGYQIGTPTLSGNVLTFVFAANEGGDAIKFDKPSLNEAGYLSTITITITYSSSTINHVKVQLASNSFVPSHWISRAVESDITVSAMKVYLNQGSYFQTDVIRNEKYDNDISFVANTPTQGYLIITFTYSTSMFAGTEVAVTSCKVQSSETTYANAKQIGAPKFDFPGKTMSVIFGTESGEKLTFPALEGAGHIVFATEYFQTNNSIDNTIIGASVRISDNTA
jgi:hypothetical protein